MLLSTKGRYGLKAVYLVSKFYGEKPVPLSYISDVQNVSRDYLEQIFITLRNDNILTSVRGAHGGYKLARSPDEITVGDIIRSLEGNLAPSECLSNENYECPDKKECATKYVWDELKNSLDNVLDTITLQDMLDKDEKGGNYEKNIC